MDIQRLFAHWWQGLRGANGAFPLAVRASVEREIAAAEATHLGEICFAVQAALPLPALWRGDTAQRHALAAFASLGAWDTEANNGVLIYVLLADRAVEIVADRGIARLIPAAEWQSLCADVQAAFKRGDFEGGAVSAVRGVAARLTRHFPSRGGDQGPRPNELPNQPVLL